MREQARGKEGRSEACMANASWTWRKGGRMSRLLGFAPMKWHKVRNTDIVEIQNLIEMRINNWNRDRTQCPIILWYRYLSLAITERKELFLFTSFFWSDKR